MLCYYHPYLILYFWFFFFFNDTATTEIYTLSLHDALPIFEPEPGLWEPDVRVVGEDPQVAGQRQLQDRKSTRLNSSHANISYAVFCLKKKKKKNKLTYKKKNKKKKHK